MRTGWQTKPLGEVCDIDKVQGTHLNLPYVGLEHIESQTARFIGSRRPQRVRSSTFRFSSEHLLYGRLRPYLNKVLAPDFDGHCSTEVFPLRPRDGLSREYLLYWFLSKETVDRVNETCTGTRMPRADMGDVMAFDFPLPPRPEQQRIVGILDEAFAAIATARANTEQNLRNAREVFESHVDAVFSRRDEGWLESRLGDLVECISTGPFGSILHKSDYQHGGVPLVNPINIEVDKIVPDDRKAVGSETAQRLARYALRENDVLVGRRGEIGRCAVVARHQSGWLCGTGCFFIRPSGRTDPYFLTHLLRSRPYRARLEGMAARATMPSISNDDLADLVVMLPPVTEQRRISALLDDLAGRTESLAAICQRKLAALDALKQSLLHQAFTGAL